MSTSPKLRLELFAIFAILVRQSLDAVKEGGGHKFSYIYLLNLRRTLERYRYDAWNTGRNGGFIEREQYVQEVKQIIEVIGEAKNHVAPKSNKKYFVPYMQKILMLLEEVETAKTVSRKQKDEALLFLNKANELCNEKSK